jgi:hypothetical protein
VIETIRRDPPEGDILSSFYLSDLAHVLENVATLSVAISSYLGLNPPVDTRLPVGQGRTAWFRP